MFCIDLLKQMYGPRMLRICKPGVTLDEACVEIEIQNIDYAYRARNVALQMLRDKLRAMTLEQQANYLFYEDRRAAVWGILIPLLEAYPPRSNAEILTAEMLKNYVKNEATAAELRSVEKLIRRSPLRWVVAFAAHPTSAKSAVAAYQLGTTTPEERLRRSDGIAEAMLSWPVAAPKKAPEEPAPKPRVKTAQLPTPARPRSQAEIEKEGFLAQHAARIRQENKDRIEEQMRKVMEDRAKKRM